VVKKSKTQKQLDAKAAEKLDSEGEDSFSNEPLADENSSGEDESVNPF